MTPLDPAALSETLGVRVVVHGTVLSTMIEARRDPGPLPAVHVAERQTAGRGRGGRPWESPAGNLHATILWPDPSAAWPPATLGAIQLAWAREIAARGVAGARVKWPNDGWIGGRKWAGISAERVAGEALLVGVGANLTVVPTGLPAGSATALADHWPQWPGTETAARLLLATTLEVLRAGPAEVARHLARWPEWDALSSDEPLRVDSPRGAVVGRYGGIDACGRLRLRTDGGERRLSAGDVERLRPALPRG